MKTQGIFLIALLIVGSQYCFGQENTNSSPVEALQFDIKVKSPYYILKVGDKSAGVYSNGIGEEFDTKKYWDAGIVISSQFIDKEEGIKTYGELGTNGVIILTFKDFTSLPQELKDRFKDTE